MNTRHRPLAAWSLLLILAVILVACGGQTPPATEARLRGEISVAGSSSAASGAPVAQQAASSGLDRLLTTWQLDESLTDFVPGELLVRFVDGLSPSSLGSLQAAGMSLSHSRAVGSGGRAQLYRLPASVGAMSAADATAATLAAARALNARDDVLYAHPNYILRALATPNDTFYGFQWHYPAINLEAAWDITTGSPDVVVAVVDSGILFSNAQPSWNHPDFDPSRILPGYDFITSPSSALDGDGRDPDPLDVAVEDGFHGTHVAGTIGAASNNSDGVSGVDWQAKLVNVRVLGAGGTGTFLDIMEGTEWAAGLSVPGVPNNANPADVINLSLGGEGDCFPLLQDMFDQVGQQAIVVVAAGNDNRNAAQFTPASCAGVITVGATDYAGDRSYYSNYGSRIDVMAPGGDVTEDLNGDTFVDGVLSLGYSTTDDDFNYPFYQGTSMAAPHVAGVIALMKAVVPDLDRDGALAALRASATPLTSAQCDGYGTLPSDPRVLEPEDCGAGLIDAALAIEYAQDGEEPGSGALSFSPSSLEMGSSTAVMPFTISNSGDAAVDWEIVSFIPATDNPAAIPDFVVVYVPDGQPAAGTLAPGASVNTSLGIDRSQLLADGSYQIHLVFELDGGPVQQELLVRFSRLSGGGALTGPTRVESLVPNGSGGWRMSGFQQDPGLLSSYDFMAEPGLTTVGVWMDENGSGAIDAGDYVGFSTRTESVVAGRTYDFPVEVTPYFPGSSEWSEAMLKALEEGLSVP